MAFPDQARQSRMGRETRPPTPQQRRARHPALPVTKPSLGCDPRRARALRRPQRRPHNRAALQRFADLLVEDGAVGVIFPEGTWEPEGRPLPFKPAGLRALLAGARFDVVPVVIDGTHRAQTFGDFLRRLGDLSITVVVGPVIPAAETADVDALLIQLEAQLAVTMDGIRRASPEAAEPF